MKKLVIILMFVSMFAQEASHTVKPGDNLWDIAAMYYQNPFLWPYIWRANLTNIQDPHWIYPDQVFVIPSASAESLAAVAQVPETTAAQEVAEVPVAPEVPEVTQYMPEQQLLLTPTKTPSAEIITLVTPDTRIFSEPMIHRAGFILQDDIPYWGKIIGTEPRSENAISTFMKIYINRASDLKVGDLLTIYRPGKIIRHPKTNKNLGKEIIVLGKAKVEAIAEGGSRCKVVASYNIIKIGDLLTPYEPVLAPENVELIPTERKIEGYVVELKSLSVLTSPSIYVYIDKGENDDIVPGDMFTIYQERRSGTAKLPDFTIGEIQVLSVFSDISIGLLLWHRETPLIKRGEKIRLAMESR